MLSGRLTSIAIVAERNLDGELKEHAKLVLEGGRDDALFVGLLGLTLRDCTFKEKQSRH